MHFVVASAYRHFTVHAYLRHYPVWSLFFSFCGCVYVLACADIHPLQITKVAANIFLKKNKEKNKEDPEQRKADRKCWWKKRELGKKMGNCCKCAKVSCFIGCRRQGPLPVTRYPFSISHFPFSQSPWSPFSWRPRRGTRSPRTIKFAASFSGCNIPATQTCGRPASSPHTSGWLQHMQ